MAESYKIRGLKSFDERLLSLQTCIQRESLPSIRESGIQWRGKLVRPQRGIREQQRGRLGRGQ